MRTLTFAFPSIERPRLWLHTNPVKVQSAEQILQVPESAA